MESNFGAALRTDVTNILCDLLGIKKPSHVILAQVLSEAILRESQVLALTGLSHATLRRRVAAGTFPPPVKLGDDRPGAASGWLASKVTNWMRALQPEEPEEFQGWGDPPPGTGQEQRLAYVRAENPNDAMTEAYLLGIDPSNGRCAEVNNPDSISDVFIGRLLNASDIAELDQFRADVAATADKMLEQLALKVEEIWHALDDVRVRINRRQYAIGGKRDVVNMPLQ